MVQEQDIEKACTVFRRSDSPTELSTFIQGVLKKRTSTGTGNHVAATSSGLCQDIIHDDSSQRCAKQSMTITIITKKTQPEN